MSECKISRVRIACYPSGWQRIIKRFNVVEKPKCFITEKFRLSKDKLLIPATPFNETHRSFSFYIWCRPEDEDKAVEILMDHLYREATRIKNEFEAVSKHLWPNGDSERFSMFEKLSDEV